MQIKLLFTDFDGVMHPCNAGSFVYLERYQDFLRKHPCIRPVLSTDWRLDNPWDYLMAMFAPDLRSRFLGATPALSETLPAARERECDAFRFSNGYQNVPWVALDNDASLFSPGCPNLVLCETVRGLRPAQLALIEQKLQLG